jgi:hypothetical protein
VRLVCGLLAVTLGSDKSNMLEFLATDPEARVRFPALTEKRSNGPGTGFTQPREYN